MSKATKRKHVTKEILEEYYVPEEDETIAKIIGGRGNNLHEVQASDGTKYLVSMPTKFRKNVWVKRGDYVIVSPVKEGVKVQGEIVYILFPKQIRYLKEEKKWPVEFDDEVKKESVETLPAVHESSDKNEQEHTEEDDDSDDDDDLFQNPNHRTVYHHEDDSETTSSAENTDTDGEDVGDNQNDVIDDNAQEILSNRLQNL